MPDEIAPEATTETPAASSEAVGAPAPTVEPAAPEAPAETPPEAPQEPQAPESAVEHVVDEVEADVATLASEAESEIQNATEAAYREAARLEALANQGIHTLSGLAVGVLHSDTEYRTPPQLGNEGPRQEQVHTSLKAG